jgi:hypothetical protein
MSKSLDDHLLQNKEEYVFKIRPVILWGGFLLFGIFCKLMHWPSSMFIILSSAGLTAYSISGLLTLKGRNLLNLTLSIAGIIWTILLAAAAFFNSTRLYNTNGFLLYVGLFCVFFLIYELLKRRKMKASKTHYEK